MSVSEVRRGFLRLTDRLRAVELAAAGRVREARAIMARQDGPAAAIEVDHTRPYMSDGRRVR